MKSAEDRYRTLLDASSALADQTTLKAVLHSIRAVLSNIAGVYSAGLYLLTDSAKALKVLALDRAVDGPAIPEGIEVPCIGVGAEVLEKNTPVFLPDVAQEMLNFPQLAPFASHEGSRCCYLFPVSTSRKKYGFVAFTSAQGERFSPEDVELMTALASHLALAVECAALNDVAISYQQQVAEEHTRLCLLLEELKRSETYLAESQKLSHTASFAFDVATDKYVYVSEECFRIFELDAQRYPTRVEVSRLICAEDCDRVRADYEKVLGEKVDVASDFRIVLPSGATKHVHTIRHPVLNGAGQVVSVVGSVMDITERKRAEEALRESDSRFRALFDHAADAFFVVDDTDDGIILDVNRQACENLGYTREELLGMSAPNCLAWDADAGMVQRIREGIAGGKVYTFEQRHRRKDGTVFPIEVRVRQFEIGGHRLHLASARDISERKRVEEERRQSAERFRAIADYTYDWENWFGIDGKLLWVNPAVERITGYSVSECMAMPVFPLPIVADADRQSVALQMGEAVQGSSRNDFEFRVRHKNGHLVWVAASWQPIYDSKGARLGYRSSMRDIRERKRAEEERRESQAQLARERDRLSLLLEINNHIVSKLEVDALFAAVAASMRKHLDIDATSFWLLNNGSGRLERRLLDFPTGRGFLAKLVVTEASTLKEEWWRLGRPRVDSPRELADLPHSIRNAMRAEGLVSRVSVPLFGAKGLLGLMHMSSRKANAFGEADVDLLSQIGTQISLALDNALAYGRLRASHDALEEQRLYLESEISSEFNFEDLVGNSDAMQRVMKQVAIVAPTDSTVLLHGETGTGKELIARAIHRGSPRHDKTFVKLNCAAIPSGLLESELFGHEKGAFTGALMQKKGRFEIADRGTLFLDEIGDISMELQPKLLRAVQEQEFERLGSTRTIHVNVRLIAATHRDMSAMIRNNQFRDDLFYRLNVFPIEIPPLRERPGDIPLLVQYFLSRLARRMQKNIKTIPKGAMEALATFSWPGNVRELENFIERAVILTQGSELNVPVAELKNTARTPRNGSGSTTFHDAERQAIIGALKAASGRVGGETGAAGRLGLKRTTLQNKMRRLNISRAEYLQ